MKPASSTSRALLVRAVLLAIGVAHAVAGANVSNSTPTLLASNSSAAIANATALNGTANASRLRNATVRLRAVCTSAASRALNYTGHHTGQAAQAVRRARAAAFAGSRVAVNAAGGWLKESSRQTAEDARIWTVQSVEALADAGKDALERVVRRGKAWMRRSRAVSRILRRAKQKQWYALLQVRRRATKKQLKDAYRRLAKRVHPDKTKDERAESAFQELRDAFDLLSDERKRKRFDDELAKQDEWARRQRQQRLELARRLSGRALRRMWAWTWLHRQWTMPVLGLLALRCLV